MRRRDDEDNFDNELALEQIYERDYWIAHTLSKGTQTLPRSIIKGFEAVEDKIQANRFREKDKADRATHQQVLDRRTYLVLLKLFKNGLLKEVNGCVSTGKEANVYHAMSPEGRELAIKIYKTSILIFKDRDRYVTGEFRFRNGYARSNPRKMVAMWAEKEYRNLLRLSQAGIHAPVPRAQRQHVLVMDFVGDDGNAASRLKDAVGQYQLTKEQLTRIYWDTVDIMKKMYQDCRLVHADLSEYNLLYFVKTEELWVIDVSQSVEHDHPHSLEFLRRDADIINKFFRNYGVHTLSARELFDYIVDAGLASLKKRAAHVEKLRAMCEGRSMADIPDDQVFLRTYIPRTLQQMTLKMFTPDQEEDPEPTAGGTATSMEAAYHSFVTGIKTAAGEESENGEDEEESDEEEEMKKEEMEEERKKAKEEEDGRTMKRQAKREQEKQQLNGLPVLPPTLVLRPLSDYFTIPLFTTAQGQNSSFSAFNTATSNKVNCVPFGSASDAVWQASNGNRQRATEDVASQAESSSDWSNNSDSEEDELTSSDSESLEEEDVGEEQPEGEEPKKKGKKLKYIEELGPDGIPIRKRGVKEEPDLKKIRKQDVKNKKREKRENKIPKSVKSRAVHAKKRK